MFYYFKTKVENENFKTYNALITKIVSFNNKPCFFSNKPMYRNVFAKHIEYGPPNMRFF